MRLKRLDDTYFWVSFNSLPQTNESGELVYITVVQDITERKQAEEALKKSEEKFHNLVESVPIGIIISTTDGSIIEANKAVVEMHRYSSREEFMKIPAKSRYRDPADRERFVSLAAKGLVRDLEVQRKRLDGTYFWSSLSSIPQTTETGERVFITVVQDITERKQAEESLAESEEKFRLLTENSTMGIFIIQDFKIVYANSSFAEVFGYRLE